MLSQKQIIEYAIKGIAAEIDALEKDIQKGYQLVNKIENGEKVKTTKTKLEILEICRTKKAEIEKLDKERFDLKWSLDVDMK